MENLELKECVGNVKLPTKFEQIISSLERINDMAGNRNMDFRGILDSIQSFNEGESKGELCCERLTPNGFVEKCEYLLDDIESSMKGLMVSVRKFGEIV